MISLTACQYSVLQVKVSFLAILISYQISLALSVLETREVPVITGTPCIAPSSGLEGEQGGTDCADWAGRGRPNSWTAWLGLPGLSGGQQQQQQQQQQLLLLRQQLYMIASMCTGEIHIFSLRKSNLTGAPGRQEGEPELSLISHYLDI